MMHHSGAIVHGTAAFEAVVANLTRTRKFKNRGSELAYEVCKVPPLLERFSSPACRARPGALPGSQACSNVPFGHLCEPASLSPPIPCTHAAAAPATLLLGKVGHEHAAAWEPHLGLSVRDSSTFSIAFYHHALTSVMS